MTELMAEVSQDFESTIMELLVFAGSARSSALMALQQARAGDFTGSAEHMAESKQAVKQAHRIQTQLIGMDEGCGKTGHHPDHRTRAGSLDERHGHSGSGR
ncbi:N,N'-diacetylchitobiose-specific phosphotransferase enzyme IIA component [Serratia fonticola]|uniref:N,N'-diacetylchitobiose-specific phosphotransferase enzyme IIA component n=1 Tax=Serratia fonticola TaxID=47917 RepID=A0A4U9U094_SERFO|nr:N,N'-diacetylchitobiose-specific phosphotransferase enzyme IIA component [Serratia fonticola]